MDVEDRIMEILRNNGYRATPQRVSVARCVLSSSEHPTAETIYNEVRRRHPTISLATVYNTLHVLEELNLVQELEFNEIGVRFDSNTKTHVNLVCRLCGEISDVDEPLIEEALIRVEKRARFKRSGQRVDVYGLCKRCANKAE
jgi:Fur family peroxide stress response transcriptional regulator